MHIHILGICGTFMGSLALLARESGHTVTGSDQNVYPPMSDQLAAAGIELHQGYDAEYLAQRAPDRVIVGNALSRGNPSVEHLLNVGLHYQSGPQWLAENILHNRWVLAVAGTHGKTTTASMLAWILEAAGLAPGFLIGGVPGNFGVSARLGDSRYFVIEADEYDTAFFDKRSKFVHYHPRTLVLNNLEFDHADIFADLAAIQTQFHHLVRTVPGEGRVILPQEPALQEVIDQGCWSELDYLSGANAGWQVDEQAVDQSAFIIARAPNSGSEMSGNVHWNLCGKHNRANALAAVAAANHVDVSVENATAALCEFTSVKRRMELLACIDGVSVYDDFAHHPSAIATTLTGLRARYSEARLIAIIEPRSNTMRMGTHSALLPDAITPADQVYWYEPAAGTAADNTTPLAQLFVEADSVAVYHSVAAIIEQVVGAAQAGDHIVIMSNGGFGGIHGLLVDALSARAAEN